MKTIDIPPHAKVYCQGDLIGTTRYVILDPQNNKITHLVVSPDNDPYYEERLIPISWVKQSSSNDIELSCSCEQFFQAERFTETKPASEIQHFLGYDYPAWPGLTPYNIQLILKKWVPKGELAIQNGSEVQATDGNAGYLDEFVISIPAYHILQLVLRRGRLWGKKEIAVPAEDIEQISQDGTIHLSLDGDALNHFPTIHLQRLN